MRITSTHLNDQIDFLSGLLSQCAWIKGALRQDSNLPIRLFLLERLEAHCQALELGQVLSEEGHQEIVSLLRIYCTIFNTFISKAEAQALMRLMKSLPIDEEATPLALSFLLACECLLSLIEKESVCELMLELYRSNVCTEFFLLVAIHFHTKRISSIIELVRSTLGLHIIFHTDSLSQIGALLTGHIFTEEDVARRAVELSPVNGVSANDSSALTLNCVYHLLRSQVFVRYNVDVGGWIYRQIECASLPIHPLLPAMVEEYVNSITNQLEFGYIQPFRMKKSLQRKYNVYLRMLIRRHLPC